MSKVAAGPEQVAELQRAEELLVEAMSGTLARDRERKLAAASAAVEAFRGLAAGAEGEFRLPAFTGLARALRHRSQLLLMLGRSREATALADEAIKWLREISVPPEQDGERFDSTVAELAQVMAHRATCLSGLLGDDRTRKLLQEAFRESERSSGPHAREVRADIALDLVRSSVEWLEAHAGQRRAEPDTDAVLHIAGLRLMPDMVLSEYMALTRRRSPHMERFGGPIEVKLAVALLVYARGLVLTGKSAEAAGPLDQAEQLLAGSGINAAAPILAAVRDLRDRIRRMR